MWFVTLHDHTDSKDGAAAEQFLMETEPSSRRQEYKVFLGISVPGPLCASPPGCYCTNPLRLASFFLSVLVTCDDPMHSIIFPKAVFLLTPTWKDFGYLFNK